MNFKKNTYIVPLNPLGAVYYLLFPRMYYKNDKYKKIPHAHVDIYYPDIKIFRNRNVSLIYEIKKYLPF